jgi:membrane protease YdiL (CAAX protease family)
MSLGKLAWRTSFDLLLVVLIAAAIATPILYYAIEGRLAILCGLRALGIPVSIEEEANKWKHQVSREFKTLPADDKALQEWFNNQAGVEELTVVRKKSQRIEIRFRGPQALMSLQPPWETLGYKEETSSGRMSWPPLAFMPDEKELSLIELGCLQLGLLTVGLWRLGQARRVGGLPRKQGERPPLPALVYVFCIVGLAAFAWLYDQLLRQYVGPSRVTAGPLGAILGLPDQGRAGVAAVVILVASFCQELFFRGTQFGSWSGAGRPWVGAAVSALAFAAFRLDWYHLPAAVVLGLVLAWLFQRTRSLPVPWLAHMVVSGVTVGFLVGVVPGWSHRQDLIHGKWVSLDDQPGTWEFTTTGTMRTPIIWSSTVAGETETRVEGYQEAKYYFIDDEHIEAKTYLGGVMWTARMKVSVTEDELTLTFDDPSRTVKYKRIK